MTVLLRTPKFGRRQWLTALASGTAGAILASAVWDGETHFAVADSATPTNLNLTILTGKMLGHPGWPAYVPSTLTVPAHSLIHVRIFNFDSGTAPLPAGSPFTKVTGVTSNRASHQPLSPDAPNSSSSPTPYTTLDAKLVSHTFSIPVIGLNVPIPPSSLITFSFTTGAPAISTWQCLAPCGSPPDGTGGAMHKEGYMLGTLHVI